MRWFVSLGRRRCAMGNGRRYTREEVIDWLVVTLNKTFAEDLSAEVFAGLPKDADDPYRHFAVTLQERMPDGSMVRARQVFPIHIEVDDPILFGTDFLAPPVPRG